MIRTFWLTLLLLIGLGSLVFAGSAIMKRPVMVTEMTPQQFVVAYTKANKLDVALLDIAREKLALESEAAHRHEVDVANQLAPIVFAAPAVADAELIPPPVEPMSPPAPEKTAETKGQDWRNANAKASVEETEDRPIIRRAPKHRPAVKAAREKPVVEAKACVQPTGLNGFLASLNLKPRCET